MVRCLNRLHVPWFATVLVFLTLFLGIKVLLNYLYGTLESPTLLADFSADLWVFPPLAAARWLLASFISIFNMATPDFFVRPPAEVNTTPSIPYLRDYVDISVMILSAFHMALVQYQWQHLSNILEDLWARRILDRQRFSKTEYEQIVHEYNHWFDLKRWNIIALTISLIMVAFILFTFHTQGIYSALTPATVDAAEWQRTAFTNWWSHPQNGWVLFAFNVSIWVIILYYIVLHNIVGVGMIRMLRRIRKHHGTNAALFVPQPGHYDGAAGLSSIQTIMVHVNLSVLTLGICLLFVYYYIPSGSVPVLTLFFLLFFALNPIYILIPNIIIGRDLSQWRLLRLEELFNAQEELYAAVHSIQQVQGTAALQQAINIGLLLATRARYINVMNTPTTLLPVKTLIRYMITLITLGAPLLALLLQFWQLRSE